MPVWKRKGVKLMVRKNKCNILQQRTLLLLQPPVTGYYARTFRIQASTALVGARMARLL